MFYLSINKVYFFNVGQTTFRVKHEPIWKLRIQWLINSKGAITPKSLFSPTNINYCIFVLYKVYYIKSMPWNETRGNKRVPRLGCKPEEEWNQNCNIRLFNMFNETLVKLF